MYLISGHRQLTRSDPPTSGFDGGLTTPNRKKQEDVTKCYTDPQTESFQFRIFRLPFSYLKMYNLLFYLLFCVHVKLGLPPKGKNAHWETGQLTDQLTLCSRILLKNLIVTQLVKKFSVFYGTWRFSAVFTRAHHWSLSWAKWIQSTPLHTVSLICIMIFIHIYAFVFCGQIFWPKLHIHFSSHPCMLHLILFWFDHPNNIYWSI
jgi:hypothetical protein